MEEEYLKINAKSKPTKQVDLLSATPDWCTAVWAVDGWKETDFMKDLKRDLGPLRRKGILYDSSGEGQLHWTLFQLQTFPVNPTVLEQTVTQGQQVKDILLKSPHISLTFRGICKTRHGLFLCGYSRTDINAIRQNFRAVLSGIVEPHPQDIYHATLFRFTEEPSEQDQQYMSDLVKKYWNTELYIFVPKTWEYGFGTWLQKERKVILSWPANPLWILHRGLSNGPVKNPVLENNETMIGHLLTLGWDVEIDVWIIDTKWYLGHDRPSSLLQNTALLSKPGVWIHCKNVEAAKICLQQRYHFFIHDTDMAVLTSRQWIWCYPGNEAGRQSVCVLPERVGIRDFTKFGAVCSDYLPTYFSNPVAVVGLSSLRSKMDLITSNN